MPPRKTEPKAPESRSERYENVIANARKRAPTIDLILQTSRISLTTPVEQRFFAAYDQLVNYAKAQALGDDCPNPLDRGESRR